MWNSFLASMAAATWWTKFRPAHVLVGHLGVDAEQLRVVQRRDEPEVAAGDGKVHVAAGLVGLGLEGELVVVLAIDAVFGQEVHRLAEALDRFDRALRGIAFNAFAAAPEHVNLRAELGPEVHRTHRLLDGIRPHLGVVAGERAVFEDRVAEQVGGRHRDNQAVVLERLAEVFFDLIGFGGGSVDRDQVVVVKVDAVRAGFADDVDDLLHRQLRPGWPAERIATDVADRPQAEGGICTWG